MLGGGLSILGEDGARAAWKIFPKGGIHNPEWALGFLRSCSATVTEAPIVSSARTTAGSRYMANQSRDQSTMNLAADNYGIF